MDPVHGGAPEDDSMANDLENEATRPYLTVSEAARFMGVGKKIMAAPSCCQKLVF